MNLKCYAVLGWVYHNFIQRWKTIGKYLPIPVFWVLKSILLIIIVSFFQWLILHNMVKFVVTMSVYKCSFQSFLWFQIFGLHLDGYGSFICFLYLLILEVWKLSGFFKWFSFAHKYNILFTIVYNTFMKCTNNKDTAQ